MNTTTIIIAAIVVIVICVITIIVAVYREQQSSKGALEGESGKRPWIPPEPSPAKPPASLVDPPHTDIGSTGGVSGSGIKAGPKTEESSSSGLVMPTMKPKPKPSAVEKTAEEAEFRSVLEFKGVASGVRICPLCGAEIAPEYMTCPVCGE